MASPAGCFPLRFSDSLRAMAFRCASVECKVAQKNKHFTEAGECPVCDEPLAPVEAAAAGPGEASSTPASLGESPPELADALPTLLGLPLREVLHEHAPVPALWALCDLAETACKLVVMAGVAEHVATSGALPEGLERELRDRVELPTMGQWLGMTLAIAKHAPSGSRLELGATAASLQALLGGREATTETGLLPLRNRLAHGGPVGRKEAERLLAAWKPRVVAWAAQSLAWLADVRLVAIDETGRRILLRGGEGRELGDDDAVLPSLLPADARAGSAWLCAADRAFPLKPLGAFDLAQQALLVYVRSGEVRLQYLRLGDEGGLCDSDIASRDLFQRLFLSTKPAAHTGKHKFTVRDFDAEIRKEASRRIGRDRELATLQQAIGAMAHEALWLAGPAGIGKSNLMAAMMDDLAAHPPAGALVVSYRFKAGDDRCGRSPFLTFVRERLEASGALAEAENERGAADREDDAGKGAGQAPPNPAAFDPVQELKGLLARLLPDRRLLLVLDGLDEIAERDACFVDDVLFRLRGDRIALVAAGRPERGLPEAFARIGAATPFPDGLPAMSDADVRALLLERTGPVRKRLLARDKESAGAIRNGFVELVAKRSDGLPIYVNYVIGDLNAGKLAPENTDALHASLHAYHDELLRRAAIGDLQAVTSPTLVLMALAYEPLNVAEIAALLVRCGKLDTAETALVERALQALGAMVRKAPDPDGDEGYALFHHSLRTHILQSDDVRQTVGSLRKALAETSPSPAGDTAEIYLYRCGVRHLLDAERVHDALALITNFDLLMARFQRLESTGRAADEWYADWDRVRAKAEKLEGAARPWWDFARTSRHLFRMNDWEAWRVLFQAAMDHADDSAVTIAAEAFDATGKRDWAWLRWVNRPKQWREDPCIAVLVDHSGGVNGALPLDEKRVLSWGEDGTLRIWLTESGAPVARLQGHKASVTGALRVGNGRILSWSSDQTLRLWDAHSGAPIATLEAHKGSVNGAIELNEGRILSWSSDSTLRIWDAFSDAPIKTLEGHANSVSGAIVLDDGHILSWSDDNTLRRWDGSSGAAINRLEGHTAPVRGALQLADGRILSWSWDNTLRLWNASSGAPIAILEGHTGGVYGALLLADGRILSWSSDHTLRLWNGVSGVGLTVLEGHTGLVDGALFLQDGRILSWSWDNTLRLWDSANGRLIRTLEGHQDSVVGATCAPNGIIISWSDDCSLGVWHESFDAPPTFLRGHYGEIRGAIQISSTTIATWSHDDQRLIAWRDLQFIKNQQEPTDITLAAATKTFGAPNRGQPNGLFRKVLGARIHEMEDGSRLVSAWTDEFEAGFWDSESGNRLESHWDSADESWLIDHDQRPYSCVIPRDSLDVLLRQGNDLASLILGGYTLLDTEGDVVVTVAGCDVKICRIKRPNGGGLGPVPPQR
jgi:WD40 repeat protein